MERLTEKDYKNWTYYPAYHSKKLCEKLNAFKYKLGAIEDFMEENGFESLEDIEQLIKNMEYYEGHYKWQCKNSRVNYEEFLNLQQENEQLKQQLAEKDKLLENAIVPKFKIGKTLFFITNIENQTIKSTKDWFYVLDNEGLFIETNNLPYNDCFYDYTFDRVFSTKQEAEEALKKMEGSV